MREIMAEAFARGLLDKIMVEVLDVIDRDREDGKSWQQAVHEGTNDTQSEFLQSRSRAHEHTHTNYSKVEEMELIAKIVRDLRDGQIGDSRYVLPPSLLALEKQMKCAACNVDDVSLVKMAADDAETQRTTQGQGDTHQIIHAATLESPAQPAETMRMKMKGETANEATCVSVGLLQQLIEQLENKTYSACSLDDAFSDAISKENVTILEKSEERFIRTIEDNAKNAQEITKISQDSDLTGRFRAAELKHDEELRSYSSQHVASTSREVDLREIQMEKRGSNSLSSLKPSCDNDVVGIEQILSVENIEKRKTLETMMKKKKKSFTNRLRKFLRAVFNRRKN